MQQQLVDIERQILAARADISAFIEAKLLPTMMLRRKVAQAVMAAEELRGDGGGLRPYSGVEPRRLPAAGLGALPWMLRLARSYKIGRLVMARLEDGPAEGVHGSDLDGILLSHGFTPRQAEKGMTDLARLGAITVDAASGLWRMAPVYRDNVPPDSRIAIHPVLDRERAPLPADSAVGRIIMATLAAGPEEGTRRSDLFDAVVAAGHPLGTGRLALHDLLIAGAVERDGPADEKNGLYRGVPGAIDENRLDGTMNAGIDLMEQALQELLARLGDIPEGPLAQSVEASIAEVRGSGPSATGTKRIPQPTKPVATPDKAPVIEAPPPEPDPVVPPEVVVAPTEAPVARSVPVTPEPVSEPTALVSMATVVTGHTRRKRPDQAAAVRSAAEASGVTPTGLMLEALGSAPGKRLSGNDLDAVLERNGLDRGAGTEARLQLVVRKSVRVDGSGFYVLPDAVPPPPVPGANEVQTAVVNLLAKGPVTGPVMEKSLKRFGIAAVREARLALKNAGRIASDLNSGLWTIV